MKRTLSLAILLALATASAHAQCAFETHAFSCASGITVGSPGVCTMTKKVTGPSGCTGDYEMEMGIEKLGSVDQVQVSPGFITCQVNPAGSYGSTALKATAHCSGKGKVAFGQSVTLSVRVSPGEALGSFGVFFWGTFVRSDNVGGVGTHSWSWIERMNTAPASGPLLTLAIEREPFAFESMNGVYEVGHLVTVRNVGKDPTSGLVTLLPKTEVPTGGALSTMSMSGTPWACSVSNCQLGTSIAPGASTTVRVVHRMSVIRGAYRIAARATGGGSKDADSPWDEIAFEGRSSAPLPTVLPKKVGGRKR